MSETTTYNVYRVYIAQHNRPDHQAIALVPAQNEYQKAGRYYHVVGDVGLGMDYNPRPGYNFGTDKGFREAVLLFQLPKAKPGEFEQIVEKQDVPHDTRVLMERNPEPRARNCVDWVDDVWGVVKAELVE